MALYVCAVSGARLCCCRSALVALCMRDVGLDSFDHRHRRRLLVIQNLLAGRLKGGVIVLFAKVGQHIACLE